MQHTGSATRSSDPGQGTGCSTAADQPGQAPRRYDVTVIGGGPAGATAASLLAKRGVSVLILEQERHPRFHIGESLLPANLPLLERLGVLNEVRRIGVFKPGADFTCADGNVQAFPFERALGDTPPHAFQVRRSEFDALLFDNCRRLGADARDGHRVLALEQHPDGGQRIRYRNDAGETETAHTRFVVDASGRHGFAAKRCGWRRRDPRHASAAVFGHFHNVRQRSGELAGNISVYWFEHGWFWMIPLRDNITSVGAVCNPSYMKTRSEDLTAFLDKTLALVPEAAARMRGAAPAGPVHATGNYSYASRKIADDGLMLVGDAYAFVDPVFSSGVFLAMSSVERSVPVIESWLAGDRAAYRRGCRRLQQQAKRKISAFSWFIYRFTSPAMRELFRNPRNDWQVEQAVIAMLAGNGDGSTGIRRRLRVFKSIYGLYWLRHAPISVAAWLRRRAGQRVLFEQETILKESAAP